MIASTETRRTAWLILVIMWAIGGALLFGHAKVVRDYLTTAGQLGLRGAAEPPTPLQQAYPAFAADAQTWVRHALSLLEGDSLRLRYTQIDNAPHGREVHWNSGLAWAIAGAGMLDHWVTGTPVTRAVERMTLWLNPVLLTLLMIVLSGWVTQRAGAIAGTVVAWAMVGHPRIFEGFFPSYADHHGLLTVAVLGLVVGVTLMGAGWINERGEGAALPRSKAAARNAAVVSALCGGFGLWISAASVLPPIAIVGTAGLLATFVAGRHAVGEGRTFDPVTWQLWGRVGGAMSLAAYLLEYFPSHLGFRMEANHPFYGLAWWGAGEVIAQLGQRFVERRGFAGWRSLVLPAMAVLIAPATILIGGTSVFIVADPFLSELHHKHIQEFLPLWHTLRGVGWTTIFHVVGAENLPLLIATVVIIARRGKVPPALVFLFAATLATTAMAWLQSRWLLNASGPQVCLTLYLLGYFFNHSRRAVQWAAAGVTIGALFLPSAITRITGGLEDVEARRVTPKDAQGMLARDIAAAIRRSQPSGDIVLVTSPNSSTSIGYYGRFKTLGTLYWENTEGLKAAAAILAAGSDTVAAELVKKHAVTHIAVLSEENFIAPYCQLLRPGITEEEVAKSFGYQLLADRKVPAWLQMLPYKVPDDLASLNTTVMLFKVAFHQTPADALYHIAIAKVAMGLLADAEADFDQLIERSPESFQPWLRKGELLFARREWDAAAEATINGISRAPAADRLGLYANAAGSFYREKQYGATIKVYRAALKERFDPNLAAYLAFVLATAKDENVRNGTEALRLAEQALRTNPKSSTYLNSIAAALAENSRFDEAVEAAEKAKASALLDNDAAGVKVTEARIVSYRARKPLRE